MQEILHQPFLEHAHVGLEIERHKWVSYTPILFWRCIVWFGDEEANSESGKQNYSESTVRIADPHAYSVNLSPPFLFLHFITLTLYRIIQFLILLSYRHSPTSSSNQTIDHSNIISENPRKFWYEPSSPNMTRR